MTEMLRFSEIADVYSPDIVNQLNKVTLWDIPRARKLTAGDMVKDINKILEELQKEIDYEKERCHCCGIHPDEIGYY